MGRIPVSSQYLGKRALMYDISAGIDHAESWRISQHIELPELFGMHGFQNREVRLSTHAETLFVHYADKLYCYDSNTGKLRMPPKDATWTAFTNDHSVLALSDGGATVHLYDAATLEPVKSMQVEKTVGACFSHDKSQLYASVANETIVCLDTNTGSMIWQKPSPLIPIAWHPTEPVMIGLRKEDSGLGGSLVMADQNSFQTHLILNEVAENWTKAGFASDGCALYFNHHRWEHRVIRFPTLATLKQTMQVAYIAEVNAKATPKPVEVSDSQKPTVVQPQSREQLEGLMESVIAVEGVVAEVAYTKARNAVNIIIEDNKCGQLLIWVPTTVFSNLSTEKRDALRSGQRLQVVGRLSKYAGFTKKFESFLQVTIADEKDINFSF